MSPNTIDISLLDCDLQATELFTIDNPTLDPVLTPNGDGIQDGLIFEKEAKVEIYNSNGKRVTQFTAPFIWEGKDQHGKLLAPGIYSVVLNGKSKKNITLQY